MKPILSVNETHDFRDQDLIGGHPALDFVNTMTGRNGTPRDWLPEPAAFAGWAAKAGILGGHESRQLLAQYSADPRAGKAALEHALVLREAMYAFLDSVVQGSAPLAQSLAAIESAWRRAAQVSKIQWARDTGLTAEVTFGDVDIATSRVVLSFVDLGQKLTSDRLRKCVGNNCGWFFFDTSKAGRRRWCDMAVCGNAAKYARVKVAHSVN